MMNPPDFSDMPMQTTGDALHQGAVGGFMKFAKGDCIFVDNWWFVVIKDNGEDIFCICDNANNIYDWKHDQVRFHLSARDAVHANSYGIQWKIPDDVPEELEMLILYREIPVDVIAEALVGLHDDRFTHWANP